MLGCSRGAGRQRFQFAQSCLRSKSQILETYVPKKSRIQSASAPPNANGQSTRNVIRCFTPGWLEVQAPKRRRSSFRSYHIALRTDLFMAFLTWPFMMFKVNISCRLQEVDRYAETVYCSLLTIVQSGCFEAFVCFS